MLACNPLVPSVDRIIHILLQILINLYLVLDQQVDISASQLIRLIRHQISWMVAHIFPVGQGVGRSCHRSKLDG